MKLTTKGRYAVTAMLDLAIHQSRRPVTLQDIATNQEISLSYLEQLFARLRRAGLVKGTRGPGGGYRLSKDMDKISVAAIITAVDEKVDVTRCGGKTDCQEGERCLTHELWTALSDKIYEFLDDISLGALVRQPEVQKVAERQDNRRRRIDETASREVLFVHDDATPSR
ncbi:MAG: Rrf2 family transcriptional regulator [Pseudomonadota bacterium]|jgi:Rrf2 family iron-sulfur cluster assembly transcriptional regulator|nr:Rrf2 family transcriptional regulator [Pseudomonadota bacterium]